MFQSLEEILQRGTTIDPLQEVRKLPSAAIDQETGAIPQLQYQQRIVPFERFEIVVQLDDVGRFLGIEEVRVNKDFLSTGQRVSSSGYLDVDEFYAE